MARVADMVAETTTTLGTGPVTLLGAVPGWSTFASRFVSGALVYYTQRQLGGAWELDAGTLSVGPPAVLTRSAVLASSNDDAPVNWGTGARLVYSSLPASKAALREEEVELAVAASGSVQGDATIIGYGLVEVATVPAGAGVVLPNAVPGRWLAVFNRAAGALKVYPQPAARIDSLAIDAALSLAAGKPVRLHAVTNLQWYSLVGG